MDNPFEVRAEGLYCKPGQFYIDAWAPVDTCIVTHGHSDHARWGHRHYVCTDTTVEILKRRLGADCPLEAWPYEKRVKMGNCWVSLHPAGHILGSAQVRIETPQTVAVVSGDYKRALDASCEPFEVQTCDIFVTESTFGLPIYQWEPDDVTAKKIDAWWQTNQVKGLNSVLFCYALGKAQRLLRMLKPYAKKPLFVHGAILPFADLYKKKGIALADYLSVSDAPLSGELILAPPSAQGSPWMKRFLPYKTALASGWMQVRGVRRRKNVDQGFILSDHADWPALLQTVQETQASLILTTHGNAAVLARYLQENQHEAYSLSGAEWMEEGEA